MPSTFHLVDFMNELEVAHNFIKFWVVWCLIFCWFAQNFSPLPFFPSLYLNFFFYHMVFWSLKRALSKFKVPSKTSLKHIQSKLKGFEFKFHVSFVSTFMNVVESNPFWWNRSPSMKIHEILEWNKVPRNIIYILFRPWNVVHSQCFFFALIHPNSTYEHVCNLNCEFTNMHKCSWLKSWIFME